ncbi:MAG: GTPase HflX, partial [Chloroflexota bacterium]
MHRVAGPQERAFLVGAEFAGDDQFLPVEESLAELARLAETAGLKVVGQASQRLDHPDSATYVGRGKVDEVKALASELEADVVLFDDELLPRHQRELEKEFGDDMRI